MGEAIPVNNLTLTSGFPNHTFRSFVRYLKSELPIAIALFVLGLGFALEHAAVENGGTIAMGLI